MREQMLQYLQEMLTDYMEDKQNFGADDHIVKSKMHAMIACKEMVEALIREPVNLQKNGLVTVGF